MLYVPRDLLSQPFCTFTAENEFSTFDAWLNRILAIRTGVLSLISDSTVAQVPVALAHVKMAPAQVNVRAFGLGVCVCVCVRACVCEDSWSDFQGQE